MTHPAPDLLHDYADDRLTADARVATDVHLASCMACRDVVASLRELRREAAALPADGPVPEGLWNEVRATIDARKVVPLPARRDVPRRWSTRGLVAAAAALVVLSSATTAYVMRGRATSEEAVALLPATWVATETGYLQSVATLRDQLDAQRAQLDPATVVVVERALAAIDVAIAEARAAMLRDPANATLSDLLASNYRQKVELLRRATQLAST